MTPIRDIPARSRKIHQRFLTSAILLVCILSNCAKKPPETEKNPAKGPKLIGQIASVATDRNFVLIESFGPWNTESGTVLTTRGTENRSANLLVTGETLGRMAAADIQCGDVLRGDRVFSLHSPKPPAAEETSEPLSLPSDPIPETPSTPPLPTP